MPNQDQSPNVKKKYDLEERTGKFGEKVIEFSKSIPPKNKKIDFVIQSFGFYLVFELWNLKFNHNMIVLLIIISYNFTYNII